MIIILLKFYYCWCIYCCAKALSNELAGKQDSYGKRSVASLSFTIWTATILSIKT